MFENIIFAIFTAVFLSILGYLKNNPISNEQFNPEELAITILYGVIVGVIVSITNFPISNETISIKLIEYSGGITILQQIVKAIYRNIKKRYPEFIDKITN